MSGIQVMLVILDQDFFALLKYMKLPVLKSRKPLFAPVLHARDERGALPVSKFKSIAELVWSRSDAE